MIRMDAEKNVKLYIDRVLLASGLFLNDGDFHRLVYPICMYVLMDFY